MHEKRANSGRPLFTPNSAGINAETRRRFKSGAEDGSYSSMTAAERKKSAQKTDKSRDSSLQRRFKQGSEYSKSKRSRVHSSKSGSDVSRNIIERIIANKDGKISDTDMRHLSDDEGQDEAANTEIDRNDTYPIGRSDNLETEMIPGNTYTLVPANQRNEFRMKFKTSLGG